LTDLFEKIVNVGRDYKGMARFGSFVHIVQFVIWDNYPRLWTERIYSIYSVSSGKWIKNEH